ncbi:MAG: late competence development ComFB family protein [Gemmatimonadota bacterium]|nr:late competence development ComFB family protein [Gemmatimonadota bacterium]
MKNLLENTLREIYRELRERHPDLCGCARCQADVMAMALNKVRPRYSGGTTQGVALAMLDLQGSSTRASLAVTLLDAMQRVGANPNHEVGRILNE